MSEIELVGGLPASVEAEIDKKIDAVRKRVYEGRPDPNFNSPADPQDVQEHQTDALRGAHLARPEIWRQVMEAHGFRWYEPSELDRVFGKEKYVPSNLAGLDLPTGVVQNEGFYLERSHRVGQWRLNRQAFTIGDLFGLYGTPEAFDAWIRAENVKKAKARFGLK